MSTFQLLNDHTIFSQQSILLGNELIAAAGSAEAALQQDPGLAAEILFAESFALIRETASAGRLKERLVSLLFTYEDMQ